MQNFINNWAQPLELAPGVTVLATGLPNGTYRLTFSDAVGQAATRWEIAEAVVVSGSATLTRGIEGTLEQDWPAGSVMYISVTAGFLEQLQGVGVSSFNARTGAVTLLGEDVTDALGFTPADAAALASVATSGSYEDLADKPFIPAAPGDIGAATTAQGALADTAVQPPALTAALDDKVDNVPGEQ